MVSLGSSLRCLVITKRTWRVQGVVQKLLGGFFVSLETVGHNGIEIVQIGAGLRPGGDVLF